MVWHINDMRVLQKYMEKVKKYFVQEENLQRKYGSGEREETHLR